MATDNSVRKIGEIILETEIFSQLLERRAESELMSINNKNK